MTMTPVEIRHIRLPRRPVGYPRKVVDRLLEEIADSYEGVWRERADLTERVDQLENDLVRYRELETLLRTTLVSAERAAHELKTQARREAELIVDEAHSEARSITRQAVAERERLQTEARRVRALLRAALETLEGPNGDAAPCGSEPLSVDAEAQAAPAEISAG